MATDMCDGERAITKRVKQLTGSNTFKSSVKRTFLKSAAHKFMLYKVYNYNICNSLNKHTDIANVTARVLHF